MKKSLSQTVAGMLLIAFFLVGYNASVDAAQYNRTLKENTRIMPPGIIVTKWDNIPKFKKETTVLINEYGEVLEGTLAENIRLPYVTGSSQSIRPAAYTPPQFIFIPSAADEPITKVLPFKSGTRIIFNDKGEVIKGTISSSTVILTLNQANQLRVSTGEISFYKNGMLETCTLAEDYYLRPVGWRQILTENFTDNSACPGFIEFKSGKPITLNDQGEVTKGTLNKDTKLLAPAGVLASGVLKLYAAGTTVEFDDKGFVVNASKE